LVEEREKGLEAYLKAILIHKDPCWRTAYGFLDFLAVPSNTHSTRLASATASKLASSLPGVSGEAEGTTTLHTSTSWMTEYTALQHILRSVRASLLKRDTLAQLGDASGSRSAGVEAKRAIKDLKSRLGALERGLPLVEGLGQGERGRREGMVDGLKDEVGNVEKMAEAGVRVVPQNTASPSGSRTATPPINESARTALLGPTAPSTRVFGRTTPQETTLTRPLDADGLVQLQKTQMDSQDAQLTQLSTVLQRQMRIGQEIGREVAEQNELLDSIDGEVDRVGGKLGRAKRQMNRCVCLDYSVWRGS
jgi:regulator of vacuolar morphogenesis